ncbi:MAG: hypothetical protein FWF15_01155 [Oscillospiraceae bacterium]|nr:hypothetical protein [Oscillospiraceae bacterium]
MKLKFLIILLFILLLSSCGNQTPSGEGAETGDIQQSEEGYIFEPYQKADLSAKALDIKNLYYALYTNRVPMLYVKLPDKNTSFGIDNDYTQENLKVIYDLLEDEFVDVLDLSEIFKDSPEDYFYKHNNAINAAGNLEIMKRIVQLMPDYYSLLLNGSAVDNASYYKSVTVQAEYKEDYTYFAPANDYDYRTRYYGNSGNVPAVSGKYDEIIFQKLAPDQMTTNISCDNGYGKGANVIVVHNLDDLSILAMFADNFDKVIAYDVRNFTGETVISLIRSTTSYELCITLLNPNGSYPAFNKGRDVVNQVYEADNSNIPIKDNNRLLQVVYEEVDVSLYIKNMVEFRDAVTAKGTEVLFVQAPFKVLRGITVLPAGIVDYTNDAADKFLAGLKENNVNYMDLRIDVVKEVPLSEIFYKNDNHWTGDTAFWGYTKVINFLRDEWKWDVNPDNIFTDRDNFIFEEYEHFYLSHFAQSYNAHFIGLDKFSLIYPKNNADTHFKTTYNDNGRLTVVQGTYYDAVYDKYPVQVDDYNYNRYLAYLSGNSPLITIENFDGLSDKKVLVVKDSFANSFNCYLSLNFKHFDIIDVRLYTLDTLTEFVTKRDYDLALFLYNPSIYISTPGIFKFK